MPAARKNKTPEASESRRKPARVPIYRKIFLELRRRIQDGEFKLGQYLPGERELCDAFDISRIDLDSGFVRGGGGHRERDQHVLAVSWIACSDVGISP